MAAASKLVERVFAYLAEFGFRVPRRVESRTKSLSTKHLERFVAGYHDAVWPRAEIDQSVAGQVAVFPDSWVGQIPERLVLQWGLYADVIYVHDPLLEAITRYPESLLNPEYAFRQSHSASRLQAYAMGEIAPAIVHLLRLKPLLEAGIVHLVPSSLFGLLHEPGTLAASDFYGPTGSAEEQSGRTHVVESYAVPLQQAARQQLEEFVGRISETGRLRLIAGPLDEPTNSIAMRFRGDARHRGYSLMTIAGVGSDGDRTIQGHFKPNSRDVNPETFKHWVEGSRKTFIAERLFALERDLVMASAANARFITSSPASNAILSSRIDTSLESQSAVTAVAEIELPYFEQVSAADLVKARRNEAAFEQFRIALDHASRELANMDSVERSQRAQEVVRELVTAPAAAVAAKMRTFSRSAVLDAVVLTGNLGFTLLGGGATLSSAAALTATGLIAKHYSDQKQKEDELKTSAGFFYWNLTRSIR